MFRRVSLVALAFLATSTPALASWSEAKTRHFIVYSEQSPQDVRDFAVRLEKFDSAVRVVRNMQDPPLTDSGRLRVYVLPDQAAVARAAGTTVDSGIAGFYAANVGGARAFVYHKGGELAQFEFTPEIVFFHEYFHHMQLAYTDLALPKWFVEGSAEFFSTATFEEDGSVMLGRAAKHRAVSLFLISDLTMKEMLSDSTKALIGDDFAMVYSRGWLLSHYLTFEPSREGQLELYLSAIQAGKPPLDAAYSAFGNLGELAREVDRYMKQKTLPGLRVAAEKVQVGPIAMRQLSPGEEAMMSVQIRLERRNRLNPGDARRIAEDARRVAARFPAEASVQTTAAKAEASAGNFGAAIAAADRALTLAPNNVKALLAKARAKIGLATENPRGTDWTAIRALVLAANKLDPENPEPLSLYYETFTAAGETPTPNAVSALLYARVLMPQDDDLRLVATRQLVVDGRFADARTALMPMVNDPHTKQREFAETAMAAIQAGDAGRALTALDALIKKRKDNDRN